MYLNHLFCLQNYSLKQYFLRKHLQMKKIGVIILALVSGTTFAQTINTDRPTKSFSSTVIPKTSLQVETGASVTFTPFEGKSYSRILAPSSLIRYGVSNYFEFRLQTHFESFSSASSLTRTSGIGDLQVGTKIRLLDKPEENTKVAWITDVTIPTGSRGITPNLYKAINSLAISHVLADNINLFYNAGFNFYPTKNGDITYAIGLGVNVTDKVSFFLEPYGEYIRLQTYQASFNTGITYLVKENLQLDFSYGSGMNHKMNFLSLGFSWNALRNRVQEQAE